MYVYLHAYGVYVCAYLYAHLCICMGVYVCASMYMHLCICVCMDLWCRCSAALNKIFNLETAVPITTNGKRNVNPLNTTGRIYTSQQICRGAHGTYIYVTMMISGSRVKTVPPFRAFHEKRNMFR